jgi:hypothetical protein
MRCWSSHPVAGACGVEGWHAPDAGQVRRNDPYDPATARHLGQCEFIGVTDPVAFKVLLKIADKGDYDWVECGGCEAAGRFRTTPRASGDDERKARRAARLPYMVAGSVACADFEGC